MITSSFPFYSQTFVLQEIQAFKKTFDIRIFRIKNEPSVNIPWKTGEEFKNNILNTTKIKLILSNLKTFVQSPLQYCRLALKIIHFHHKLTDKVKSIIIYFLTVGSLPEIKKYSPDHIHAHFANFPALSAYIIHQFLGIPYSFNCHGTDVLIDRQMLPEKGRTAKFITTISRYNKNALLSNVDREITAPVHVFYLGTDIPDNIDLSEYEKGSLLFVGRLASEKNIFSLIKALPLINQDLLKKVIIAGDGHLKVKLQKLAMKMGVNHIIQFKGMLQHDEVKKLYKKADIFVLPSFSEGLPISLLEAMAHGAVGVASTITGIPEVISHEKNGFLIEDPRNIQEIASKIETALQAPHQIRNAAYDKVKKDFDLQSNLSKKAAFFHDQLE